MSADALSPAVKQLLSQYIRSVEQLEVLLLFHGNQDRPWTASEVYDVVRSSKSSVAARLEEFAAHGFLQKMDGPPPSFRYAPNEALRAAIEETARAYHTWRVRVIEAIFAPEADAARSFADAFKMRRD